MDFILVKFTGTVTEFVELCDGTTNPLFFDLSFEAQYFWRVDSGPERIPYTMYGSLFADDSASVYIGNLTWWCAVEDADEALTNIKSTINNMTDGRQRGLMFKFDVYRQNFASEDALAALPYIKKSMKQKGMLYDNDDFIEEEEPASTDLNSIDKVSWQQIVRENEV